MSRLAQLEIVKKTGQAHKSILFAYVSRMRSTHCAAPSQPPWPGLALLMPSDGLSGLASRLISAAAGSRSPATAAVW